MSGLVRYEHEIPNGTRALECVHCNTQYPIWDIEDLGEPLTCVDCNLAGMIPRRRQRIADKFPGDVGERFTVVPYKLLDPNNGLDLGLNEIAVIIALETFRWSGRDVVYPSQETIAGLTRLSRRTVQRTLDGLVSAGLIAVRHDRRVGRFGRNVYDISPLWERLAGCSPELRRAA